MSVQTVNSSSQIIQQEMQQAAKSQAEAFVKLDDSQLKMLAQRASYNRQDAKSDSAKMAALFCAVPIIDTLSKGILHESTSMGEKVLHSTKAAGSWAGFLAFLGLYSSGKKLLASKSDTFARFENNNPGLSMATDLGVFIGASFLSIPLIRSFVSKHPAIDEKLSSVGGRIKTGIDKTKLNNKFLPWISEKVSKFEKLAPRTLGAGKFVLANSMWFMLGASLAFMFHRSSKQERAVENNYIKLKTMQNQTAEYLKANGES